MTAKTKTLYKEFNLLSFLNKKSKIILNKIIPNILIKWLMEKDYTHLGFEISNACMQTAAFVLIDL